MNRVVDGDYPKEISEGFTGIPDHLDAALVWGGNGKIYFFKNSKFWRFDPLKRPPVKATYPKLISNWEGVPNNIDAALQYTNGFTYFFKDDTYYRFNDRTFTVDASDPPFPRPTVSERAATLRPVCRRGSIIIPDRFSFCLSQAHWWFGCKNVPQSFNLGNVVAKPDGDDIIDDLILDAGGM